MARKTRLTPEIIDAIVKRVRIGVYPYIAAQAVGIPKSTFYTWMSKGEQNGAGKLFRELLAKVREASATARSHAETRVFRDRPLEWLRLGPGRERPGDPGWTESPQTLVVEGHLDHGVEVQQRHFPADQATIIGALALFQELGLIIPTEEGRQMFEALSSPEGNGKAVIDVDSADDRSLL